MTTRDHFSAMGENENSTGRISGYCKATHRITREGEKVDFMYRDEPEFEGDSGWRFLSGTESQAYAEDPGNWVIYSLEALSAKDKAIIPYLNQPVGTALGRVKVPEAFR